MKVFLTGGSGLIGRALTARLVVRGDEVVVLTRAAARVDAGAGISVVEGDPGVPGDWQGAVSGCDAVVNLAGEPIFGRRWSAAQKRRLRESRLAATRSCLEAIVAAPEPPLALVSASAIGYYGAARSGELPEDEPPGGDFLAGLCADWEAAAREAEGVRVAIPRIGIVLARGGGALEAMLPPFRFFAGGPIASGNQVMSWIHLDDLTAVFEALLDGELAGPVNAVAPGAVSNREFCRTLARVLGRPSWLRVPRLALRVLLGEVADTLATGQRVIPARLAEAGFAFRFPELEPALRDLLATPRD